MPIYEYQCKVCGHQLEMLQGISEKPLSECPACHAMALDKLISATSFQLKGTGWYATDFRDKGKPQNPKTAESASSAAKPAETTAPAKTTNDGSTSAS